MLIQKFLLYRPVENEFAGWLTGDLTHQETASEALHRHSGNLCFLTCVILLPYASYNLVIFTIWFLFVQYGSVWIHLNEFYICSAYLCDISHMWLPPLWFLDYKLPVTWSAAVHVIPMWLLSSVDPICAYDTFNVCGFPCVSQSVGLTYTCLLPGLQNSVWS